MEKRYWTIFFLILILFLAGFCRFWQIGSLPPGLYPDEAMNGNDALASLETNQWKVYYPENNGREGLFIWLNALGLKIFGIHPWSLRIVSAFFGTLTILGLYLLTKQLFNKPRTILNKKMPGEKIALLSAFLMAVSFWHINFSRIDFRAIMVPFLMTFAFYFLLRGLESPEPTSALQNVGGASEHGSVQIFYEEKKLDGERTEPTSKFFSLGKICVSGKHLPSPSTTPYFILAGIFFGLGFYTYIAFRMAVLVLAVLIILKMLAFWWENRPQKITWRWLWRENYLKNGWWKIDLFLLIVFIVALPIGLYFLNHPQDFIGRASGVSVFNTTNLLKEIALGTIKTLGMFNFFGDWNWRHNYAGSPMLAWPVGLMFIIGLIMVIKKSTIWIWEVLKEQRVPSSFSENNSLSFLFILSWFLFMLLPAILTYEGLPHALRTIGVIPAVYIISGLGLYWLFNFLKGKNKSISVIILIAVLAGAAFMGINQYFFKWAKNPNVPGAFRQDLMELADYLNNLPTNIQKYVIVNEDGVAVPYPDGIPMPAQTIIFIAHKTKIVYLKTSQIDQIKTPDQPTIIIPIKYDENLLNQLRQKFPNSKITQQKGFYILTF